MKIDLKELADFLREARKNTYANKDAQKSEPTRLRSNDYHFEKDGLIYHDTYFGSRDFIGGEVVYKEGAPVWGMNYYGYVLKQDVSEGEVYSFLRKALMQECSDIIPVRGEKLYESEEWRYINNAEGGLERFKGAEEIYKYDELVYRADYHGGSIE